MSTPSLPARAERTLLPSAFPAEPERPDSTQLSTPPQSQYQQPDASFGESSQGETNAPHLETPFFTLIEDSATGRYYHPTVHYIFSDDDADQSGLVTEAALRSVSQSNVQGEAHTSSSSSPGQSSSSPDTSSPSTITGKQQARRQSQRRVEERYILLDLDVPQGTSNLQLGTQGLLGSDTSVTARSLTPSWQVLSAELTSAPTWDDAPGGKMEQLQRGVSSSPSSRAGTGADRHKSTGGNVMLRVQGTEGLQGGDMSADEDLHAVRASLTEEGSVDLGERDRKMIREMNDLVAMFGSRMDVLRKVAQPTVPGEEE
ncbi:MAG: hypothetical protein M4579_004255 [Chaenotheca gracillima]|nr:MAG: hypothetical protein M4579_004255 [Chaenotheca gracillima]